MTRTTTTTTATTTTRITRSSARLKGQSPAKVDNFTVTGRNGRRGKAKRAQAQTQKKLHRQDIVKDTAATAGEGNNGLPTLSSSSSNRTHPTTAKKTTTASVTTERNHVIYDLTEQNSDNHLSDDCNNTVCLPLRLLPPIEPSPNSHVPPSSTSADVAVVASASAAATTTTTTKILSQYSLPEAQSAMTLLAMRNNIMVAPKSSPTNVPNRSTTTDEQQQTSDKVSEDCNNTSLLHHNVRLCRPIEKSSPYYSSVPCTNDDDDDDDVLVSAAAAATATTTAPSQYIPSNSQNATMMMNMMMNMTTPNWNTPSEYAGHAITPNNVTEGATNDNRFDFPLSSYANWLLHSAIIDITSPIWKEKFIKWYCDCLCSSSSSSDDNDAIHAAVAAASLSFDDVFYPMVLSQSPTPATPTIIHHQHQQQHQYHNERFSLPANIGLPVNTPPSMLDEYPTLLTHPCGVPCNSNLSEYDGEALADQLNSLFSNISDGIPLSSPPTDVTSAAVVAATEELPDSPVTSDAAMANTTEASSSSPTSSSSRRLQATVAEELPIPPALVFKALFNYDMLWQLWRELGITPLVPATFDISGWTEENLDQLCKLWETQRDVLPEKWQSIKTLVFESKLKILHFSPVPLCEAFALEFPNEVLSDRFFHDPSNLKHDEIFQKVRFMTPISDNIYGKPSVISATGMQQLQPSTKLSQALFAEGRRDSEICLFDTMVQAAIAHVTQDTTVNEATMNKKIAFLYTIRHWEQAPHRDFSRKLLCDRRRLPITPWGLDMPLSAGGLLLNVWPNQERARIVSKRFRNNNDDPYQEYRRPFTLDVPFRQVLLFAGDTVHGGGFRRRQLLPDTADKGMDREGGCYRMHMYLSFATPRRTHAALEGQDQVELEDDSKVKYSCYLLKSDGTRF